MFHVTALGDILLAIAAFVIVLFPAVVIHELGHFFAAKLVGISVLEFGIGFPPRVRRLFMWRETEFTLNLLPIGGFVRPLGEDMIGPVSSDKRKRDATSPQAQHSDAPIIVSEREMLQLRGMSAEQMRSVNETPPLGRVFFMAAGALANFVTAFLLLFLAAILGLWVPVGGLAQVAAIPPRSIFTGTPVQVGDAIEKIDGERFTDFAAFHDTLAAYPGETLQLSLLRGDSAETYNITVPARVAGMCGAAEVLGVEEGSPAANAGILPGDVIVQVHDQHIPAAGDPAQHVSDAIRAAAGQPLPLTILRSQDGEESHIRFVTYPRAEAPPGQGLLGVAIRAQIGLVEGTRLANAGQKTELIPQSIPAALSYSWTTLTNTFKLIASVPGRLLDGSLSGKDARPISVIGISKIGGEYLQRSFREGPSIMLQFTALISIFLGITNLLPIPALDGGRIVFVLLEMLRGKPIKPETEARIHQIGILLLLLLGVAVMILDVLSPPSLP